MTRNRLGVAVLLGAAALLLAPATGSAQMMLPGRFGGWGGSYGYSPGFYSYGYVPYRGGYYGSTWAYPSYSWGGYGYSYPRYVSYGNSYSYPSYSLGGYSSSTYSPIDYYSAPGTASGSSYSYGAPASAAARDTALLNVRLPAADAEVWVEGKRTQQGGTWREYQSPPLNPDKNYIYEVRARWSESGRDVERTKTVSVRANGTATADFTAAAGGSRVDEIKRPERP
jgi:uncharacterized protein (TIGR03000 family)